MGKRVCLFGDSIAKGVAWNSERQRYQLLKGSAVKRLKNDLDLSIDNFAKFGCTIVKGKELISQKKQALRDYDYVALEFGGNDCNFNWSLVAEHPDERALPEVSIDQFVREYLNVIELIRAAGGAPVIISLPPIEPNHFFEWVSQGLDPEAILLYLGDKDHIYRWHEMYNLAVFRVALESNAPLVDITSRFLDINDYQKCVCEDGIHLNEEGHLIVYEELVKEIDARAPWLVKDDESSEHLTAADANPNPAEQQLCQ